MTETGNLIRQRRKRKGLTQAALARLAGVTQHTVSRWETGGQAISADAIAAVAAALDVSPRSLIPTKKARPAPIK